MASNPSNKVIPFPQIRTALIPSSYDPEVTDFSLKFNGRAAGEPAGPIARTGPIRSNPIPFTLVGNAPAIVICSQNAFRKGLMIQNKDLINILYVGFGALADLTSFQVAPLGGTMLLDFVCPTDTISVFATANVSGFLLELAPTSE